MSHYTEVELLEHYYLNESSPEIAAHVASCFECAARYGRLREKLSCSTKDHAATVDSKPEPFWMRQRASIRRGISEGGTRRVVAWPRLAAAAILLLLVVGAVYIFNPSPDRRVEIAEPGNRITDPTIATIVEPASSDPWEIDELEPYSPMIEWESWLEEKGTS
jgi:hypothetical protein